MKIVALIKTWSGQEWLKACIDSIYPHVYKIVLLTSDISWIGGRDNPSIPVIEDIEQHNDPDQKIIHINHDEPNQMKHCMYAYSYIKNSLDCDYVQLIDSDELWSNADYKKAIEFLTANPDYNAYRTNMYTYVKSALYRVDPPEPLKPVCFIKPNLPDMGMEPRGCAIKPFIMMPDVWCHHFVFVRAHFNHVLEKLIQSHVSEKQPYESMDRWIPEVWNKLPNYNKSMFPNGAHPAIGFGAHWKRLKQIEIKELPECLFSKYKEVFNWGRV